MNDFSTWLGQTQTYTDSITPTPIKALQATLDCVTPIDGPAFTLPPAWHWLYFLPLTPQSDIGPDGHAKRGGFLPPVPLPRRMWAGSQMQFHEPLKLGDEVRRVSRIAKIEEKQGRSGRLVFVEVAHQIYKDTTLAISETHDIVYRDLADPNAPPPKPQPSPTNATWSRTIVPDDVLLFRYSALTFNGHRIHYDRRYVTEVEGYPGLIVHGPLIATLLLNLIERHLPVARVSHFSFKAVSPVFDIAPFSVHARQDDAHNISLWALTHEGHLAMHAQAKIA